MPLLKCICQERGKGLGHAAGSERLGISAEGREFPILALRVSAHPRAVPCCLLLTPHSNASFALLPEKEGRFQRQRRVCSLEALLPRSNWECNSFLLASPQSSLKVAQNEAVCRTEPGSGHSHSSHSGQNRSSSYCSLPAFAYMV